MGDGDETIAVIGIRADGWLHSELVQWWCNLDQYMWITMPKKDIVGLDVGFVGLDVGLDVGFVII